MRLAHGMRTECLDQFRDTQKTRLQIVRQRPLFPGGFLMQFDTPLHDAL
jgi:hypothetical protein